MSNSAVDRFLVQAHKLGLQPSIKTFPAETRTAQQAAEAIGCTIAQIVKSLVFIADGKPVLALTSGSNRVDEDKLAQVIGADSLRKANADEVREATGFAIGGTPPFGHATAVPVVCDRDLTTYDEVWAAAGSPTSVFALTPQELLDATSAEVVDLAA